jgi:hypothetical protein
MIPVKADPEVGWDGRTRQAWYRWQVCANCIAARAKARCYNLAIALAQEEPLRVDLLQSGKQSEYNKAYGWFSDVRDNFLAKDLGFYSLWLCRDGAKRTIADL